MSRTTARPGRAAKPRKRFWMRNPYPKEISNYPDYLLRDMGFDPFLVRQSNGLGHLDHS